jgi:hypothetical protein
MSFLCTIAKTHGHITPLFLLTHSEQMNRINGQLQQEIILAELWKYQACELVFIKSATMLCMTFDSVNAK